MADDLPYGRKYNYAAGPTALPVPVMEKAQKELLNYNNTGQSVMELSHRTKDFQDIIDRAFQGLRELLNVPDNYKILFLQGGGTGQFAATAMNLIKLKPHRKADYLITGTWSKKAAAEAEKYGTVNKVLPSMNKYTGAPPESEWKLDPEASYIYYCSNETVHGVEFAQPPESHDPTIPLVCDMSSNIMSKEIDISKFGVIFFGAQKNLGPTGVTGVIIRDDLIGHAISECPTVFDYKVMATSGSMLNTPPTWTIYVCGLVFDWIKEKGGLKAISEEADKKSAAIYNAIDQSNGFYVGCAVKEYRSRMNVTFRIGDGAGDEELAKKFTEEALKMKNMIQVKGHRSVGGMRISLYNAIPVEHALRAAEFMRDFQQRHAPSQS